MLRAIFSLDYEIHGNGEGSPFDLMVEPTARMMNLFEEYGAKLTILADVAEILKFKQYKEEIGRDDLFYDAIAAQLRDAIRRGHDVQLHLHPSYFNAKYENGRWLQDWSEYSFSNLSLNRISEILRIGKEYLESLLQPERPSYRCNIFRAANWSMCPSQNAVRALIDAGFVIDTSVFKYGQRRGLVEFDYTNAHSDLLPWSIDANDVCRHDPAGRLWEVPIFCERRWIGAFFNSNRVYRVMQSRAHRFDSKSGGPAASDSARGSKAARLVRKVNMLFQRHPWKADFNQCTGSQLIRALERAHAKYNHPDTDLPFVLIGHSKTFTRLNERSLRPFLAHIAFRKDILGFGLFSSVAPFNLDRLEGNIGALGARAL